MEGRENDMRKTIRYAGANIYKLGIGCLLMAAMLFAGTTPVFSGDRVKPETIDATAQGTGNQLGQIIGITVIIYEFSTPADRQVLVDAFSKGKDQGLVNA